MKKTFRVGLYHDPRYKKKNGKLPVKLRVYSPTQQKPKLYPLGFDLTKEEFKKVDSIKPAKGNLRRLQEIAQEALKRAEDIIAKDGTMTFQKLEKKLFRGKGDGRTLIYHYQQLIYKKANEGRLRNADAYLSSMNSLKKYCEERVGSFDTLTLEDVNVEFLENYEDWGLSNGLSVSSIGSYLRHLRGVYNSAIDFGDIEKDYYPFGKNKYSVQTSDSRKGFLSEDDIKRFRMADLKNEKEIWARDWWFISFYLGGANIKDLALLRKKDVEDSVVGYYRSKTHRTSKTKRRITHAIGNSLMELLEKYKSDDSVELYFGILSNTADERQVINEVQGFNKRINKHLKAAAARVGIDESISLIWARHTYATVLLRMGRSIEFIQEQLGHESARMTRGYVKGFAFTEKRNLAERLEEI